MSNPPPETPLPPAPRRMYIGELLQNKTTNFVRIMGTLVTLRSNQLTLDDGTGILHVSNDLPIKGAIGQTLDVICRRNTAMDKFQAETIIWNVSPQNETLRSLQLSYKGESKLGYACPTIKAQDIKQAVDLGGGVTIQDLCMVLELSKEHVESCLQELQLAGEIYCNREGKYVPL